MTILEKLKVICDDMHIPFGIGIDRSDEKPDAYIVLVPISDSYAAFADDCPTDEVNFVRISLYKKGDYTELVNSLCNQLLEADLIISDKGFIELETDTMYNHYNIDVKALSAANEGI